MSGLDQFVETVEEGVTLSAFTNETTAFLQDCFRLLEAGQEDRILSDPFYTRNGGRAPLTDAEIDNVIEAIDKEYETEITRYPEYHRNRSGANALPEFGRLSPRARRAMVEGLDRIVQRYRQPGDAQHDADNTPPSPYGGYC